MKQLENCPVCKSNDLIIDTYKQMNQVVCNNCITSTNRSYKTINEAIDAWNTMSRLYHINSMERIYSL